MWYYTGYGEAEVICDSINETQSFHVTYIENYPKGTYLDRIIEWTEVTLSSPTFNFMDTEPLTITKVNFQDLDVINITLLNTGTANVLLTGATVVGKGLTGTIVTMVGGPVTNIKDGTEQTIDLNLVTNATAGNLYTIELKSSKGNKYQYTTIASP